MQQLCRIILLSTILLASACVPVLPTAPTPPLQAPLRPPLQAPIHTTQGTAVPAQFPPMRQFPAQPQRILLIGNLFLQDIDVFLKGLAEAANPTAQLEVAAIILPATWATLDQHAAREETFEQIRSGDWDVVVLQEQCAFAILNEEAFCASTQTFDTVIREAGAQTAILMLWGYKDDPEITTERVATACTHVSEQLGIPVIPAGLAWTAAMQERPALDLYLFDGMRANLHGRYLTANVFYASLFGASPEGLDYIPAPPEIVRVISSDQALFLQRIAWESVQ